MSNISNLTGVYTGPTTATFSVLIDLSPGDLYHIIELGTLNTVPDIADHPEVQMLPVSTDGYTSFNVSGLVIGTVYYMSCFFRPDFLGDSNVLNLQLEIVRINVIRRRLILRDHNE